MPAHQSSESQRYLEKLEKKKKLAKKQGKEKHKESHRSNKPKSSPTPTVDLKELDLVQPIRSASAQPRDSTEGYAVKHQVNNKRGHNFLFGTDKGTMSTMTNPPLSAQHMNMLYMERCRLNADSNSKKRPKNTPLQYIEFAPREQPQQQPQQSQTKVSQPMTIQLMHNPKKKPVSIKHMKPQPKTNVDSEKSDSDDEQKGDKGSEPDEHKVTKPLSKSALAKAEAKSKRADDSAYVQKIMNMSPKEKLEWQKQQKERLKQKSVPIKNSSDEDSSPEKNSSSDEEISLKMKNKRSSSKKVIQVGSDSDSDLTDNEVAEKLVTLSDDSSDVSSISGAESLEDTSDEDKKKKKKKKEKNSSVNTKKAKKKENKKDEKKGKKKSKK